MIKTVKINATPEVMALAKSALDIQSAVNPLPVTLRLMETQDFFRKDNGQCENWGSDMSIQNPISKVLLEKLCSLARCFNGIASTNDFQATEQLAKGLTVSYEIDTLAN